MWDYHDAATVAYFMPDDEYVKWYSLPYTSFNANYNNLVDVMAQQDALGSAGGLFEIDGNRNYIGTAIWTDGVTLWMTLLTKPNPAGAGDIPFPTKTIFLPTAERYGKLLRVPELPQLPLSEEAKQLLWDSNEGSYLHPGTYPADTIIKSRTGGFDGAMILQQDGNLVTYTEHNGSYCITDTNVNLVGLPFMTLTGDGRLTVGDDGNPVKWDSQSGGIGFTDAYLIIGPDLIPKILARNPAGEFVQVWNCGQDPHA
jgi:hypothetical protein